MPKTKAVDLGRVKKALTRLDAIARDHPELLGQSTPEQWEETLKEALDNLDVFTIAQAANVLNCHENTVRKAIRTGSLVAARIGRDFRISRSDLERYWQAQGGKELFYHLQAGVLKSEERKAFEQVCADQGADPEKIIHNFMADFVRQAREAKQTGEQEGPSAGMKEIMERRKREAEVKL